MTNEEKAKLDRFVVINEAIKANGEVYKMDVAIQELSELQKEICKIKRGNGSVLHLAEEMADVENILDELKIIFGNAGMVEVFKNRKIARLDNDLKLGREMR